MSIVDLIVERMGVEPDHIRAIKLECSELGLSRSGAIFGRLHYKVLLCSPVTHVCINVSTTKNLTELE